MPDLADVASALMTFGGDPLQAGDLAAALGFHPVAAPVDLLRGAPTPLRRFLEGRDRDFGVGQLYRVGTYTASGASLGLYVAVLNQWGHRSTDRDRPRRRVARALVELTQDARMMFIMVPGPDHPARVRREAEFVLPRPPVQGPGTSGVTTVRALVDLQEPSRFHRDLLRDLAIIPGSPLLAISQRWQAAFSVERVTKRFYQEYAQVRNRLAAALKAANPDHPVVRELTDDETRAWATRQLGRILFLWFLQAKRWLGYDGTGQGSPTYLLDLWERRNAADGGYYRGLLVPLFFEAMAKRHPPQAVRDLLGYTPYLNGGLFRPNPLEDRIAVGGPVELPDDVFDPKAEDSVLGFLSRYRFTTRESTPDDQSVDPDPELLGQVFENLYQADERHDTGTYYTPREIVHFMCRQALDGHLRDTTGVDQETLDWLRREVTDPEDSDRRLDPELERRLIEALETVRVCDPAVGSGAFLLGAMQEIVLLRRGIEHAKHAYIEDESRLVEGWKRRAIQWSLYGVDINPEAVEICQLRLWLSLVLDMDYPQDVEPLPNLDFRIVAGDSLIDRVGDIVFYGSLPLGAYQIPMELSQEAGREERNIEQWRQQFEAEDDPRRQRELRDRIIAAQQRIVRHHLEAGLIKAREEAEAAAAKVPLAQDHRQRRRLERTAAEARSRVEHLERLLAGVRDDAPYQKPFLWPVMFPEVFRHGGFDIVLANPPYVRQERLAPEDQESYRQAFPEVFSGTADILVFFYARAVQILREGGWLAFITSNKYMRAGYGEGAREHLPRVLRIHRVIDFGDLPLFESNGQPVAAYPAVLVARKDGSQRDHAVRVADLNYPVRRALADAGRTVNTEHVRWALEGLEQLLAATEVRDYPQVLLRREGWILEDPALVRLFQRLMSQGTPLGEYVQGRIYYGIKTGLNEAFVIDEAKRAELIAADPRSAELIKPWLRGRDIKRWRADWSGLYVIAIQNSGDADATNPWASASTEQEARRIFRETYPAIHEYLSQFEQRLRIRADQGRWWWELRACTYYREFERPKVIWPDITRSMRFAYDQEGYFGDTTVFFSPKLTRLHVVVLNSSVAHVIFSFLAYSLRGSYLRLKTQYVERFPLGEAVSTKASPAIELFGCSDQEQVDDVVMELYGLRRDERALIGEWMRVMTASETISESQEYDDTESQGETTHIS